MAEVASDDVVQSGIQLQDSSSYINGNCVNCMLMNEKYQEASGELKSLRLINSMFHEEIKTLRNQQEDNNALRERSFSQCKKKKVSSVQCSSVVSAQVTCDLKQNQTDLNDRSEDIENLRCDLTELIEIRMSASRQFVREVITSDINLLTNKIESLKDDVSYKESTVTQ